MTRACFEHHWWLEHLKPQCFELFCELEGIRAKLATAEHGRFLPLIVSHEVEDAGQFTGDWRHRS